MRYFPTIVALFCLGMFAGCPADHSQQSTPTAPDTNAAPEQPTTPSDITMEDTRQKVGEAAEAVGKLAEQKTAETLKAARANYEDAKQKIAELKVKMDDLHGAAKEEFQKTLDSLETKAAEVEKKLQELGNATGQAWNGAQDDLSNAMSDLEKAYQGAKKSFQKSAEEAPEGDTSAKSSDATKDSANQ